MRFGVFFLYPGTFLPAPSGSTPRPHPRALGSPRKPRSPSEKSGSGRNPSRDGKRVPDASVTVARIPSHVPAPRRGRYPQPRLWHRAMLRTRRRSAPVGISRRPAPDSQNPARSPAKSRSVGPGRRTWEHRGALAEPCVGRGCRGTPQPPLRCPAWVGGGWQLYFWGRNRAFYKSSTPPK